MATVTAKLIPPSAPPPRAKLELDLSVDEAHWLKELAGRVLSCGEVRTFTTQIFCELRDKLSPLPGYDDRPDVFSGEVRSLK